MKLHKLLYYCQAWNLVWEDKKLFNEKIKSIRSEGHFDHEDEDFTVSEAEGHYFITDECDDYYEDITIKKATVL